MDPRPHPQIVYIMSFKNRDTLDHSLFTTNFRNDQFSYRPIFVSTNFRFDQFSFRPIFVSTNFLRLIFVRPIFIRPIFVDPFSLYPLEHFQTVKESNSCFVALEKFDLRFLSQFSLYYCLS